MERLPPGDKLPPQGLGLLTFLCCSHAQVFGGEQTFRNVCSFPRGLFPLKHCSVIHSSELHTVTKIII